MVTESTMKAVMQKYIDSFNEKDADGLISLFADNAKIEDPVGGGQVVEGISEIKDFYKLAVTRVDKLELSTSIRGSHSNSAAMAFSIFMTNEGKPMRINAIDVMTFNEAGKIIDMKAYHGPGDVS